MSHALSSQARTVAMAASGLTVAYLVSQSGPAQQRMIRAQSNARPLDSTAQHTGAARLQRTPSWQTKVCVCVH